MDANQLSSCVLLCWTQLGSKHRTHLLRHYSLGFESHHSLNHPSRCNSHIVWMHVWCPAGSVRSICDIQLTWSSGSYFWRTLLCTASDHTTRPCFPSCRPRTFSWWLLWRRRSARNLVVLPGRSCWVVAPTGTPDTASREELSWIQYFSARYSCLDQAACVGYPSCAPIFSTCEYTI